MTSIMSNKEKYKSVKDAYLNDILPNIWTIFENTHKTPEVFILSHCAILSLSGFYLGTDATTKTTYKEFIKEFFPKIYNPAHLYSEIRCNLIHAYTIPKLYIMTWGHSELHLSKTILSNARTGERARFTFLNFENFYNDLLTAAKSYFKKAMNQGDLLINLSRRFDIVPPNVYVVDE